MSCYLCSGFCFGIGALKKMKTVVSLSQMQERLVKYLEANRMRCTSERIAILKYSYAQRSPFTVGEVYSVLEKEGFHVSRSTVYDTLRLLCRCEMLVALAVRADETRFAFRKFGHLYLVCTSCGKIREEKDSTVTSHFKGRKFEAFTPTYFTTAVYGLCSTCHRRLSRTAANKRN